MRLWHGPRHSIQQPTMLPCICTENEPGCPCETQGVGSWFRPLLNSSERRVVQKKDGQEFSLPSVSVKFEFMDLCCTFVRTDSALASCEVDAGRIVAGQFETEGVVAGGRHAASQSLTVVSTSQSQRSIANRIASLKCAGVAGLIRCRPAERSVGLQDKLYACSIAKRSTPVANMSGRLNLCCLRRSKSTKCLQR